MENGEQKTCQVITHNENRLCGRPVYDDNVCVCHSNNSNKDYGLFQRELDSVFADQESQCFDLTGFCFPNSDWKLPTEFRKDVFFTFCRFLGPADFDSVTFLGAADFSVTMFYDWASFLKAIFTGEANFRVCRFFKHVSFQDAQFLGTAGFDFISFHEEANFISCTFTDFVDFYSAWARTNSTITFNAEEGQRMTFPLGADFSLFRTDSQAKIRFRRVSFEGCRLIEMDATCAEFTDVLWPKTSRSVLVSPRHTVHDEYIPDRAWINWNVSTMKNKKDEPVKFQYHLIAQLYRRLQQNYINNYRYSEAGDFYIGEQEMMRKAKGKIGQYLSTNFLYKIISYYGESFLLPLFWLAFVLLLFPAVLLYDGINLSPDLQNPAVAETVNYEWSWSPGDFLPVNGDSRRDYWEAFVANFSLIAYSRSDIGKYLTESHTRFIVTIESLVVIALLAFFLLALRRQYKRKTF